MSLTKVFATIGTIIVSGGMLAAQELPVPNRCEVRFLTYVSSDTIDALLSKIDDTSVCAESERVHLTLQTGGGEIDPGMFAYKMLRKRGVDTHVEYSVASMGVLLLLSGDERTMAPDAYLLIHQVTQYLTGDYEKDKLKEYSEGLEISHSDYVKIVSERTGLPSTKVEELMADHAYLNAIDALELGFITKITED